MNINSVKNTSITNENKVSAVRETKAPVKQIKQPVNPENKDTFVRSTEKDNAPKTYNASGKINDNAVTQSVVLSTPVQAQPAKPVIEKKEDSSTQKVQSVKKSINTRA